MTSRPTPPAGDVPARRASSATSCTAICVVGSVSRRSWSASSITRQLGMPPPHESHHLPAAVICAQHPLCGQEGSAPHTGEQANFLLKRATPHRQAQDLPAHPKSDGAALTIRKPRLTSVCAGQSL